MCLNSIIMSGVVERWQQAEIRHGAWMMLGCFEFWNETIIIINPVSFQLHVRTCKGKCPKKIFFEEKNRHDDASKTCHRPLRWCICSFSQLSEEQPTWRRINHRITPNDTSNCIEVPFTLRSGLALLQLVFLCPFATRQVNGYDGAFHSIRHE